MWKVLTLVALNALKAVLLESAIAAALLCSAPGSLLTDRESSANEKPAALYSAPNPSNKTNGSADVGTSARNVQTPKQSSEKVDSTLIFHPRSKTK